MAVIRSSMGASDTDLESHLRLMLEVAFHREDSKYWLMKPAPFVNIVCN